VNDETSDPLAILAALGMPELARVTPITGGADTLIWRVEHGDSVSALRVFRSDQTRTVRREVAALTAANAAGVPVPEIRAEGI
jgi:aminoglycoside phosphotransferase (APT) family kinase protein